MQSRTLYAALAACLFVLAPTKMASAQSIDGMRKDSHGMMGHADHGLADGEVRKVDKDAGKLTIKHGPIPSIDMPPMTMVYRVKEAAMLDRVKVGDKIKFDAEKLGDAYTVTRIDTAK